MSGKNKPTVISLFCGTGGSSLGYKLAGYKELLAVDYEAHAVECFQKNFKDVPIWHKSVIDITGKEILDFCNIKKGELDILDGSPPCQGFSISGGRKIGDMRNSLYLEYIRLIKETAPKVFVMENVPGMVQGKMKSSFLTILKDLKKLDYNVKCKKMNSKYYNVPQSRERLIFIGVRKDLKKEPVYPIPNTKLISVKEAFKKYSPKNDILKYIKSKFLLSIVNDMQPGESAAKYNKNKSYFNMIRIGYVKPARTIAKTINALHPLKNRFLSINEVKLLCSFPINWELGNNFSKAWARLGNSVMPNFMKEIALTIKKEILNI